MNSESLKNGKLIDQAQAILKKTYKEVQKINKDLQELINDRDPTISFVEEYSYGPKAISLKSNHTFLYKENIDESIAETVDISQKVFACVVIMNDEIQYPKITRITYKDQPEIWFLMMNVNNRKAALKPWSIANILGEDVKLRLKANGEVFNYQWAENTEDNLNEKGENRDGEIIGFALTDIIDKEFLQKNVIDKLFIIAE
jgi:hypothetical protein